MERSFIAYFENKLLGFENELRKLILTLFKRKNEATTYEIGDYVCSNSIEFMKLKEYNRIKAWYRLRKILQNLEREGVLRKEMSGKKMKNLRFFNYRWIRIGNK